MRQMLVNYKHIFKQGIFALGVIIVITALMIFVELIGDVKSEAKASLEFRVSVFEELVKRKDADASFLLNDIIREISHPVIITTPDTTPQSWRNIEFFSADTAAELRAYVADFEDYAAPIPMMYDSLLLGYYFYSEPDFLSGLKWLPVIVLALISLLLAIAYVGVMKIRTSEKQYIWFGMAKEAAHQLGTPTSSLSGWIELMKNDEFKKEYVEEVENDLGRIQTVINRFSMIGSPPKLEPQSLNEVLHEVVTYFRTRQPQFSKHMKLELIHDSDVELKLNRELIVWVFENLIKNAMDAISHKMGKIELESVISKDHVTIWCRDNGQGMEASVRKKIFEPGFSTKRRGWGIGLSLTKRIVDEFHGGKISVESSTIGKGTRFKIILPR